MKGHPKKVLKTFQLDKLKVLKSYDADFNAGDYVKVTVLLMRDNLEKVSKNYLDLKQSLAVIPAVLGAEMDADMDELLAGAAQYLKKFKAVNDALSFYWAYQSWFEEFHFSSRIEEATQDLKR